MYYNLAQPNHAFATWAAGAPTGYTRTLNAGTTEVQLNRTDKEDHPQRLVMAAGRTLGGGSYIYEGPSSYRAVLLAGAVAEDWQIAPTLYYTGKKLKVYGVSLAVRSNVEGALVRLRIRVRDAVPAIVRWLHPTLGWVTADAYHTFRLTPVWSRIHVNFEFPLSLIDWNWQLSNNDTGAQIIDVGNVWIPDPMIQEAREA